MPGQTAMEPADAIAIVGLGGLFPGAGTLDQLWANIRDGIDATSDVPHDRWLIDPSQAFDPRIALEDHVYSTRVGVVDRPRLDASAFALDPSVFEQLDPLFHLALHAAREAWRDAHTSNVDRAR